MERRELAPGQVLLREREQGGALILVEEGELEVTLGGLDAPVPLATVGPRDLLGEVGFITRGHTTATVSAKTPCLVWELSREVGLGLKESDPELYVELLALGAQRLGERLGEQDASSAVALINAEHLGRQRRASSLFILLSGLLLSGYSLILATTSELMRVEGLSTMLSLSVLLLFTLGAVYVLRDTGYGLHRFGLHLRRWRVAVIESLAATLVMCALVLAVKLWLIQPGQLLEGQELLRLTALLEGRTGELSASQLLFLMGTYLLYAPLQELIARGALQSGLQEFLVGARRTAWAVVLSNLLFAAAHAHISLAVAALVFLPGLVWGALFARHRSLLGVCLSHLLLGWFTLYMVGFPV